MADISNAEQRQRPTGPGEQYQADREARNPLFRWMMHLGLPLGLSIVLHILLFGVLAFKTWEVIAREQIDVGEYEAGLMQEPDPAESSFQWPEETKLETPDDDPLDSLDSLDALRDLSNLDLSEDFSDSEALEGAGEFGLGQGEEGGIIGIGSGAGEAGSGGFGGGGSGRRGIGVANMWGERIFANKIVYVVDFSGSITVAVDDLKRALKRSIGGLKPSQSFNVVLFYGEGLRDSERFKTESFKPSLQQASESTRAEFIEWIDRKAPQGSTDPLPALERGLKMSPEAILFFSDGLFDEKVVGEVDRLNRSRRTKVYCFLFDELLLSDFSNLPPRETDGAARLRRIAEQNGNTKLKIVTGNDLRRG